MTSRFAAAVGLGLIIGATGCGLRSNALFTAETDFDPTQTGDDGPIPDGGVEGRRGSCSDPIPLPPENSTARGELAGGSLYTGWCGNDGGPEDVYLFAPPVTLDVTVRFNASETEFTPVLRVQENGCFTDEGVTRMCDSTAIDGGVADARHFIAIGGRDYFIHVDSRTGRRGEYAFDLIIGPPPLEQCNIHDELIEQTPGGIFAWQNEFSLGQGRADSLCGGPGKENMFRLLAQYPGTMTAVVNGSNGFRPVLSVRTGCGAGSELECVNENQLGTPGFAELSYFIPGPGEYFLVVDQLVIDGGTYDLQVIFD